MNYPIQGNEMSKNFDGNKKIEKNNYYNKRDKVGHYLSKSRNKFVLSYIKGRLLDLGCGDGELIRSYKDEADGVDIKDYGYASIIAPNFSQLPIKDRSYNTVTIVASLNYFENPNDVLDEVRRVLTDDGQLILTMPNALIMKFWHKIREPWANHSGFSKSKLISIATRSNYELIEQKKFLCGLNALYVFKKLGVDLNT